MTFSTDSTSSSLFRRLRKPSDNDAWDLFAKIYAPLIFRWLLACGLKTFDAEDVTQQVIKRFFEMRDRFVYDSTKSFRGYLRTMARRLAINYAKANHKHQIVEAIESDSAIEDDDTGVFGAEMYKRIVVNEAFEQIRSEFNDRDAEFFLLRYREGWKSNEVARRFDVTPVAVRTACSRIRARLRELLKDLLD